MRHKLTRLILLFAVGKREQRQSSKVTVSAWLLGPGTPRLRLLLEFPLVGLRFLLVLAGDFLYARALFALFGGTFLLAAGLLRFLTLGLRLLAVLYTVENSVEFLNFGREASQNPWVLQRLLRFETLFWLPDQNLMEKVEKAVVLLAILPALIESFLDGLHALANILALGKISMTADFLSLLIHLMVLRNIVLRNDLLQFVRIQERRGVLPVFLLRVSDRIGDVHQLLGIVRTREDGLADLEFRHEAAETPHVDGEGVGSSQHDFWGAVVPRLQILVDLFPIEAAGAEVHEFYSRLGPGLHYDVFRLQVAVDNIFPLQKIEGVEDLDGEDADHVLPQTVVVVGSQQFVEVPVQQLKHDALN